jgi:hypothetical protein
MKTLMNQKLLIDSECPMCNIYGNAFEKYNLIEKNTCLSFQDSLGSFQNLVDFNRAQNEIALVDIKENKIVYGIDAFIKIIEVRSPFFAKILRLKWIYFLFSILYRFISQNRKVIAPSQWSQRVCTPNIIIKYRLAYIAFVAFFSSAVIFNFTQSINVHWGWENNYYRELLICIGQILWQTLFLKSTLKDKIWDYLGNMSTVSLIGTFLLIPGTFIPENWITIKSIFFGSIILFMLVEHLKRCRILELNIYPSISWVVYRSFVLALLIIFQ